MRIASSKIGIFGENNEIKCNRMNSSSTAAVLGRRCPGACPPSATGRGRGPPETSSRAAGTQETVGGYGVERSGTEPPGYLVPDRRRLRLSSSRVMALWSSSWFCGMAAPERKVSMPSRNSSMVIWSRQGSMGYLSFRRFRWMRAGADGFAEMRCVAVTGEKMIFAVLRTSALQGGERPMGMFKRFLSIFRTVYAL